VEHEESVEENASNVGGMLMETSTTISEPSTKAYDPKDGDYVEGESEHETTPKPAKIKLATEKIQAPTKKTPSKKRKSTFERLADDGGLYKPSRDSDSDPESEVKKPTQSKKTTGARPRKLQKTAQESDGEPNPKASTLEKYSRITTGLGGVSRNNSSAKAPVSAPSAPSRSNSLKGGKKPISPPPPGQKDKLPQNGKQTFSPPPSSSFTGLDYTKPSVARQIMTPAGEHVGRDIAYSADPTTDDNVPPMPALPKEIRLHSGEVIKTTTAAFASQSSNNSKSSKTSGPTKLTKPRPAPKESKSKKQVVEEEADDDFHWDRDTF
jgi:hypothetical protein